MPVATVQSDGVAYYVHSDNLGTPRSITRPSDNVEVWRWHSEPFGTTAATRINPNFSFNLRFAGQYFDEETGYHYNWMRHYDPRTGRYLEADPLGLGGGLARYTYVDGNPLSSTDPTGLLGPAGVAFGFTVGFVGNVGLQYFLNGGDWRDISINEAMGAGIVGAVIVGTGGMGGGFSGSVAAWAMRGTNSVLDKGGTAGIDVKIGIFTGPKEGASRGSWRDWLDTSGPYPTGPAAMCPR